jgi:hypothetical protein
MPPVGFKPTIAVTVQSKEFRNLDCATTEIGIWSYKLQNVEDTDELLQKNRVANIIVGSAELNNLIHVRITRLCYIYPTRAVFGLLNTGVVGSNVTPAMDAWPYFPCLCRLG